MNLTIPTEEFTSKAFYPHAIAATEAEKLAEGFVSPDSVSRLVDEVMMSVVLPIVPGSSRQRFASTRLQAEHSERRREPDSNLRETPAERRVNLQDRPIPSNPLQIGRSDLDPLPLQNQPNPLAPSNLIPPNQGDGMFVGPDHPIFGGPFGPGRGQRSPGQTPWGGDGYLPPLGAPPGARFDPVGPFGGGSPLGGPGRQPFGRAPPRSGDPDFDEALPPGFDNGASSFGAPRPFGGSGRSRGPGPMPPGAVSDSSRSFETQKCKED